MRVTSSIAAFPVRRGLLDHVAIAGDPVEGALQYVAMQPGGLGLDVDQLVLLAGDDDDLHLQLCLPVALREGIRNHQTRLGGGRPDVAEDDDELLFVYLIDIDRK